MVKRISKAPAKRSQHVNATYRNSVGRNMLRTFDHLVEGDIEVCGIAVLDNFS